MHHRIDPNPIDISFWSFSSSENPQNHIIRVLYVLDYLDTMLRLLLLLSLTAFRVAFAALSSPLGPVVSVKYANFIGNTTSPVGAPNGPVGFFGNIPYAQPPLGNLRFRAPQPLNENSASKELTDSRNWGPACVQIPAVVGIGSEGALH